MNSSDDVHQNGISEEDTASGSQEDNNANVNNVVDQSKGAIPKTRCFLKNSASLKKSTKVNNNIETLHTLNNMSDPLAIMKINGFTKSLGCNLSSSANEESLAKSVGVDYVHKPLINYSDTSIIQEVDLVNDSDSSNEDNELLSVSDDGCIYTYKGDNIADLPSSFFNLELPSLENIEVDEPRQGNSSPEMDFLEMDFDPGPSGDADSDSISISEVENNSDLPLDLQEQNIQGSKPCSSKDLPKDSPKENYPKPQINIQTSSTTITNVPPSSLHLPLIKSNCKIVHSEVKMPWSCTFAERTRSARFLRTVRRHHSSFGELLSPKEYVSPTTDYTDKINSIDENISEKIMIWTEQEASVKQITQIGPSSCGATAVLNVLNALRLPIPPIDKINELVNTRLRANLSPLPDYLLSRSKAGCTHREIISGLDKGSDGQIYARFFAMHPERLVNMYKWLGFWIQHGAIPVATINLQTCSGNIPDSWHHQMIYGVGPNGIYLTNPLEYVDSDQLWPQLISESVLLVRREDVISRWNPNTDLLNLMRINDSRWRSLNVIGQIAKIIREKHRGSRPNSAITSHVSIPADYKSGITLAIDVNSPAYALLHKCPELPLLNLNNATNALL